MSRNPELPLRTYRVGEATRQTKANEDGVLWHGEVHAPAKGAAILAAHVEFPDIPVERLAVELVPEPVQRSA